ncbi:MAG: sigma 54-dependent Fis family transcriptional regulator [Myxococcales bacterium]|nr:sigma 54-dependent Fis family transcriptional regulator [Myxococcales bacterium]
MSKNDQGWTTSSIQPVTRAVEDDPTPGLVLIYSRLHAHLPACVALSGSVMRIGREADNDLAIPEGSVSRHHARVELRDEQRWLVDLGSTNGTLLNGRRIDEAPLREHDVVRIGDAIFRYASSSAYAFIPYRLDGTVAEGVRPVRHGITSPLLRGGYQIDRILAQLQKVAPADLSVVILGETGTGKELIARQLHASSARPGPLQAINCAALPSNLIESQLFGYRKGAFTGASSDRQGLIKAADRGTLFLDEIGDLPLEAQAKLLRVLQEREVLPIGATRAEPVDVRIVCATHRRLDRLASEGRFRDDLLARLREFTIELPPLRHRREDLLNLVRHFLRVEGHPNAEPSFAYMLALAHYAWPYNVRELGSAVKLSIALAQGGELDLDHLPPAIQAALDHHGERIAEASSRGEEARRTSPAALAPAAAQPGSGSKPSREARPSRPAPDEAELRALLTEHRGNIAAVGRALGKERMQVHRWLKRFGIDIQEYREP